MALLLDDFRDPEPPSPLYDGLGPDEFDGWPEPHPVARQIARGLLYAGAGLFVGWAIFHWLAGAVAGGLA